MVYYSYAWRVLQAEGQSNLLKYIVPLLHSDLER